MDNRIAGRAEDQERVVENNDKELMYEQLIYNTDDHKIKVYKVTDDYEAEHLITFSYDRAWNKYVERLNIGDNSRIELIEVEE